VKAESTAEQFLFDVESGLSQRLIDHSWGDPNVAVAGVPQQRVKHPSDQRITAGFGQRGIEPHRYEFESLIGLGTEQIDGLRQGGRSPKLVARFRTENKPLLPVEFGNPSAKLKGKEQGNSG
jgi:hypothetical protein